MEYEEKFKGVNNLSKIMDQISEQFDEGLINPGEEYVLLKNLILIGINKLELLITLSHIDSSEKIDKLKI